MVLRKSAEQSAETERQNDGAEATAVEVAREAHRDQGGNGGDRLLITYIVVVEVLSVATVIALVLWGLLW